MKNRVCIINCGTTKTKLVEIGNSILNVNRMGCSVEYIQMQDLGYDKTYYSPSYDSVCVFVFVGDDDEEINANCYTVKKSEKIDLGKIEKIKIDTAIEQISSEGRFHRGEFRDVKQYGEQATFVKMLNSSTSTDFQPHPFYKLMTKTFICWNTNIKVGAEKNKRMEAILNQKSIVQQQYDNFLALEKKVNESCRSPQYHDIYELLFAHRYFLGDTALLKCSNTFIVNFVAMKQNKSGSLDTGLLINWLLCYDCPETFIHACIPHMQPGIIHTKIALTYPNINFEVLEKSPYIVKLNVENYDGIVYKKVGPALSIDSTHSINVAQSMFSSSHQPIGKAGIANKDHLNSNIAP